MTLGEDITHKVASIKDFSIFLDCDDLGMDSQAFDIQQLLNDTTNKAYKAILDQEF